MTLVVNSALSEINSAIYATVGGLVIGGIIKFANKLIDRKKNELDEHVILRKELREELDSVKEELRALQTALDEWKEKYYHQVELTNELKVEVQRLNDEIEEYKTTGMYPVVKKQHNDD